MKLVLAIVHADSVDLVSQALTEKHFTVTHISSQGGFLRRVSTTIVVGVEEAQVQTVIGVIREICSPHSTAEHHAATIFVVESSQFLQI